MLESNFSLIDLHKFHWNERAKTSKELYGFPKDFYLKVEELIRTVESKEEKEKIVRIAKDIIKCRLRKILIFTLNDFFSEQPTINSQVQKLTNEETEFYRQIESAIACFLAQTLTKIVKGGGFEF